MILGPLSYILTPRAFHRANVFLIRLTVRHFDSLTSASPSFLPDRVIRTRDVRLISPLLPPRQTFPLLISISLYERIKARPILRATRAAAAVGDIFEFASPFSPFYNPKASLADRRLFICSVRSSESSRTGSRKVRPFFHGCFQSHFLSSCSRFFKSDSSIAPIVF
jgi:hypothetical protein